jgi:hypothetical protein
MQAYILNDRGQCAVRARILAIARADCNPDAWFEEIEEAAEGFNTGDTCGIEISARHAALGVPEALRLRREWFDTRST